MNSDHNTLGFGRPWGAPRRSISGFRCRSPGFDWLFAISCSLHVDYDYWCDPESRELSAKRDLSCFL